MKGKAAWNNWPLKKLLLDKISVPKSIYSLKALLQTRVFFSILVLLFLQINCSLMSEVLEDLTWKIKGSCLLNSSCRREFLQLNSQPARVKLKTSRKMSHIVKDDRVQIPVWSRSRWWRRRRSGQQVVNPYTSFPAGS